MGFKLLENPFLLVFDITGGKPPVSDHPKSQEQVVSDGWWSLTRGQTTITFFNFQKIILPV